MRIRKRKMLFPQSTLPDPLVQFPEPYSTTPISSSSTQDCLVMKMQDGDKDVEEDKKESKDTKNESIHGAQNVNRVQPEPTDSSSLGKTAIRLSKKRMESFDSKVANASGKTKMKTKMNNKNVKEQPNGDSAIENGELNESVVKDGAKKVNRSGLLMEGSRCSRVNGRGWRCSQPTLVGYSLCEHHLGKGRLRSMNTVKGRFLIGSSAMQESAETLSLSTMKDNIRKNDDNGDGDEDEDEEPLMVTKKKIKLGMVKAKSISSLLGQADHSAIEADNGNN